MTPDTIYTYRVRAYKGSDNSDYSNEAIGKTKSLIISNVLLGLPHFTADNNLVVSVYLKGEGTGTYSGRWLSGASVVKEVTSATLDLSSGDWVKGDELVSDWASVSRRSFSLLFTVDDEPSISTPELTAAITGFRPDVHGWQFANDYPLFGVCAGMADSALVFYNTSISLPQLLGGLHARPNYRYLLEWQAAIMPFFILHDTSRAIASPAGEISLLVNGITAGHPRMIGLIGGTGSSVTPHAVVATATFSCDMLFDFHDDHAEVGDVKLFAIYDPDLPLQYNHIVVTSATSNNYRLRFFINVVPAYRNERRIVVYTGP